MTEQAVREPVVLRHKDASRQSALYAVFALVALAPVVPLFLAGGTARWASIVLLPVVLVAGYAALRLATLKVRLDADGIWEPDPFRLTYVTPWSDVKRAERCVSTGRVRFVGVRIVHADGGKHEVEALKVQAGAAYAEPIVEEWLEAINDARDAYLR